MWTAPFNAGTLTDVTEQPVRGAVSPNTSGQPTDTRNDAKLSNARRRHGGGNEIVTIRFHALCRPTGVMLRSRDKSLICNFQAFLKI